MIVKSISHKASKKSSIKKLISYVFNQDKMKDIDGKELVVKKFIGGYDKQKWSDAFKKNDDNRTFEHARRTVLRHEIISFSPESTPW